MNDANRTETKRSRRIGRLLLGTWIAAAFLLASVACGKRDAEPPPPASEPAETATTDVPGFAEPPEGLVVAMGDSLTEGYGVPEEAAYPALLENRLREAGYRFEVVNAGISGETSAGARSRTEWILNLEPDIVILATGGNDGLRGVDPANTRANIAEILDIFRERDVVAVLAGMRMFRNLGAEFVDAFEALYPDVAAEKDVLLVPFLLEGVAAEPALNLEDGIHPNAEGYRVVAENVFPHVEEAIRRWRAARRDGAEIGVPVPDAVDPGRGEE